MILLYIISNKTLLYKNQRIVNIYMIKLVRYNKHKNKKEKTPRSKRERDSKREYTYR